MEGNNKVLVNRQWVDLDHAYLKFGSVIYVRKDRARELMTGFVKRLIDEGKLAVVEGHEEYFKSIIPKNNTK